MILASAKAYQLKYFEPLIVISDMTVVQIWHRRQEMDAGLIWLRKTISQIYKIFFKKFNG